MKIAVKILCAVLPGAVGLTVNRVTSCLNEDVNRRLKVQNKIAGVCEEMCKNVGAAPKCAQCPNFVAPDSTPGVMTWEELLEHMDNLADWGSDELKSWRAQASVLQKTHMPRLSLTQATEAACNQEDVQRRKQLQNGLGTKCLELCKKLGADCSQCEGFVPPDSTPGVMTWDELLEHMDNLVNWSAGEQKKWVKQASALQTAAAASTAGCSKQDLSRRVQLQNKLAGVCNDMCKQLGAKCAQCPDYVKEDSTPGVMTWEELLEHMDNLVQWGQDSLKGWHKQAR